jgi:hypothetical protein
MTLDELEGRLKAHDHYYERSDDHSVFLRGQADRAELIVELRSWPMFIVARLIRRLVPQEFQANWFVDIFRTTHEK